ncbi:hypothetical protein RRG08_063568 [Elysia crispata]|uniref:Uncharacterized protein n=1 Tax=Elysia crispata TaxID=231223 RepID=A0AAE0YRC5_9GAST|nr:hypothetical protein RRG08_063568 [Elysia crispata]
MCPVQKLPARLKPVKDHQQASQIHHFNDHGEGTGDNIAPDVQGGQAIEDSETADRAKSPESVSVSRKRGREMLRNSKGKLEKPIRVPELEKVYLVEL